MHKTISLYEAFGLSVVIDRFPVMSSDHKLQSTVTTGGFYRVLCKIHKGSWVSAMLESLHPVK